MPRVIQETQTYNIVYTRVMPLQHYYLHKIRRHFSLPTPSRTLLHRAAYSCRESHLRSQNYAEFL